jgi:hypothetical protein
MLCVLIFLMQAGPAMAIEEPSFDLVEKSAPFEIRQYQTQIIAETIVDGELSAASSRGFRLIAGFIFGDNRSIDATSAQQSEKIAMTAPVTVEPQTDAMPTDYAAKRWRIQFTMPGKYSIATLPKPVNPAVTLREIPAKRYAIIVFSGFTGTDKIQKKTSELLNWMQTKQLQPIAAPQLARYDPPWILPFFRRNEILIEISAPE